MNERFSDDLDPGHRTSLILILGIALGISLTQVAYAQEKPRFHPPDSAGTSHEHFYVPSMSPGLIFSPPQPTGNDLSLADQFMIDSGARFHTFGESWKRSFLLGASTNQASLLQMPSSKPGKPTFFQHVQVGLGLAELAGVAYLGYKAIKKEPITKKK